MKSQLPVAYHYFLAFLEGSMPPLGIALASNLLTTKIVVGCAITGLIACRQRSKGVPVEPDKGNS